MPTRDVKKAKKAYKIKDVEGMIKAHKVSKGDYEHVEHHVREGKYLKSVVYGGLDGIVTTFAIVAGVTGASLTAGIVLILGFANLIADGISMGVGDYLSTKSEREYHKAERRREQWEVENYPEGEKVEMVQLYKEKGLSENDSKKIVSILSKNEKAWIDTMMVQELGLLESDDSPFHNGLATFLSFVFFGFIPLIAYIVLPSFSSKFLIASILTAGTLFLLGALKVRITERSWFKSGFEMMIVGGIAALAAYFIGNLLSTIIFV